MPAKRRSASVYEMAQCAIALRQAGLERWLPSLERFQAPASPPKAANPFAAPFPAPYRIWTAQHRLSQGMHAADISPWHDADGKAKRWAMSCHARPCPVWNDVHPDFASALVAALRHLEANGMSPGPRIPQRGLAIDERTTAPSPTR